MVNLTERAAMEVRKMQEELKAQDKGLRIEVTRGGCQGYTYEFGFDERQEGDQISLSHDITILARPDLLDMVDGMTIDFVSQMAGDTFVFENPKAARTCGCGNSFGL
ncbi:MAG: iron-sulfur cluster assembly accessory protein [Nitrospinota bacterium]|nr:iron-sulfur cluster assembly accessory protein [Nitrospinota bacterium]